MFPMKKIILLHPNPLWWAGPPGKPSTARITDHHWERHITYHCREHKNQKEFTKTEDFSISVRDEQLLYVMDTHWKGHTAEQSAALGRKSISWVITQKISSS